MTIGLADIGKRFGRNWIFRHVDLEARPDQHLAILGPNGSGKSTLLQVILGSQIPTEGQVTYSGQAYDSDHMVGRFSMASPYLELIEEFTLSELAVFHNKVLPFRDGLSPQDVVGATGLIHAGDKFIKHFSSGMKQRVRLALAVLSDTELVLLDEPTSNLDRTAVKWYHDLVQANMTGRTVIVASNRVQEEYAFCTSTYEIVPVSNVAV
jgi:ABC-type multidrug transport system ATPase subunit